MVAEAAARCIPSAARGRAPVLPAAAGQVREQAPSVVHKLLSGKRKGAKHP